MSREMDSTAGDANYGSDHRALDGWTGGWPELEL